jgi:hypothetical protein
MHLLYYKKMIRNERRTFKLTISAQNRLVYFVYKSVDMIGNTSFENKLNKKIS